MSQPNPEANFLAFQRDAERALARLEGQVDQCALSNHDILAVREYIRILEEKLIEANYNAKTVTGVSISGSAAGTIKFGGDTFSASTSVPR